MILDLKLKLSFLIATKGSGKKCGGIQFNSPNKSLALIGSRSSGRYAE